MKGKKKGKGGGMSPSRTANVLRRGQNREKRRRKEKKSGGGDPAQRFPLPLKGRLEGEGRGKKKEKEGKSTMTVSPLFSGSSKKGKKRSPNQSASISIFPEKGEGVEGKRGERGGRGVKQEGIYDPLGRRK